MSRVSLLAMVHIARKELKLDDDTYRGIVRRITGKFSSGDCADHQLDKLLVEFRRLGWQRKPGTKSYSPKANIRLIFALWKEISARLEGEAGDAQLRSFVRRQTVSDRHPEGISAPEFLDTAQATKVIEGLKGWLGRLPAPEQKGDAA